MIGTGEAPGPRGTYGNKKSYRHCTCDKIRLPPTFLWRNLGGSKGSFCALCILIRRSVAPNWCPLACVAGVYFMYSDSEVLIETAGRGNTDFWSILAEMADFVFSRAVSVSFPEGLSRAWKNPYIDRRKCKRNAGMSYMKRIVRQSSVSRNFLFSQTLGRVVSRFVFPRLTHRRRCLRTVCFSKVWIRAQLLEVKTSGILDEVDFRKCAAITKLSGRAWSVSHSAAVCSDRHIFLCDGKVQRAGWVYPIEGMLAVSPGCFSSHGPRDDTRSTLVYRLLELVSNYRWPCGMKLDMYVRNKQFPKKSLIIYTYISIIWQLITVGSESIFI